jgi:FOG: EAL domain
MLAEALRTLARWQADGLPWRMAVNLSAQHLEQEQLADELFQIQRHCGVDLSGLSVEISETAMLKGHAVAHHTLSLLQQAGVTIALDGFGAGHSSLDRLIALPIDQVKIDRSLVARLGQERRTDTLVRGFVQVFRELGLAVVAKGVESGAQQQALLAMGCALGQGFLFGRPTPLEQPPWSG